MKRQLVLTSDPCCLGRCADRGGSCLSQPLQGGRLSGKKHPDSPRTRLGREEREETGLGQCGTHISQSLSETPHLRALTGAQGPDMMSVISIHKHMTAQEQTHTRTHTHAHTHTRTHTHTRKHHTHTHTPMSYI